MAKSKSMGFSYRVDSKTGKLIYKEWGELTPELRAQADGWKKFAEEQNQLMPVKIGRSTWIRIPYPEHKEAAIPPVSAAFPRMTKSNRLQFFAFLRTVAERYGLDDKGFEVDKAAKGLGLQSKVLNAILTGYTQPEKKHLEAVSKHVKLDPLEILNRGAGMLANGLD